MVKCGFAGLFEVRMLARRGGREAPTLWRADRANQIWLAQPRMRED